MPAGHHRCTIAALLAILLAWSQFLVAASKEKRQSNPLFDFLPNQTLPDYALTYAPYFYLHSQEAYFPVDYKEFLTHVLPYRNGSLISNAPDITNASALGLLPDQGSLYLTAQPYLSPLDQPRPGWFAGDGAPDSQGHSAAPAIIIASNKNQQVGPGYVDVFYFGFYAWNRGNSFYNNEFGNHVADWEQTMIRFLNGTPVYIVPEAHGGGEAIGDNAYTWETIPKRGDRPIVYAANGTHGMYAVPGTINYTGTPAPIYDETDKGHLWDLTLNYRSYFYSNEGGFVPTNGTPEADRDVGFLNYSGSWGDQQYNKSIAGQTCIGSECFYTSGPAGPGSKSLARGWLCGSSDCTPRTTLPAVLLSNPLTQDTTSAALPVAASLSLCFGVVLVSAFSVAS